MSRKGTKHKRPLEPVVIHPYIRYTAEEFIKERNLIAYTHKENQKRK